jgi:hypothetical protein
MPMPIKALPSWLDGIHVSMAGSFIALEGAWRQHSERADAKSVWHAAGHRKFATDHRCQVDSGL